MDPLLVRCTFLEASEPQKVTGTGFQEGEQKQPLIAHIIPSTHDRTATSNARNPEPFRDHFLCAACTENRRAPSSLTEGFALCYNRWQNDQLATFEERVIMPAAMEHIEINPSVMLGKPVIRGTRIPVELLLRKLGEGATEADLLDAYPRLTRGDIQAALAYAAEALAHETILLQPA